MKNFGEKTLNKPLSGCFELNNSEIFLQQNKNYLYKNFPL